VTPRALIPLAAVVLALVIGLSLYLMRGASPSPELAESEPAPAASAEPAPVAEAMPVEPAPTEGAPVPRAVAADPVPVAPAPAEPVAIVGTLRISSDVAGAQVFIDRRFLGTAPLVAENIAPGSHQLNVSAEGFESIVETVDVEPGTRDIAVKFREVRLDVGLDVIHKHRMGSCRGRLVATPQGMRYETSNRNDAFEASLLELETFEVDYLDKNLRVKVSGGRQYNFTDPDGDADRLFVFHRDVERARERLGRGDQPAP